MLISQWVKDQEPVETICRMARNKAAAEAGFAEAKHREENSAVKEIRDVDPTMYQKKQR